MLGKLSVRGKILLAVGVVCALTVALGGISQCRLGSLRDATLEVESAHADGERKVRELQQAVLQEQYGRR